YISALLAHALLPPPLPLLPSSLTRFLHLSQRVISVPSGLRIICSMWTKIHFPAAQPAWIILDILLLHISHGSGQSLDQLPPPHTHTHTHTHTTHTIVKRQKQSLEYLEQGTHT